MARTLVDTSAFVSLLDADDSNHRRAVAWLSEAGPQELLMTHNYVIVETAAVASRKLGSAAVRAFLEDFVPQITPLFVDDLLHRRAVSAYLAALRRKTSLVDWVSFEVMRDLAVDRAFAFDRDFADQGFETVP